jgi:transposase
VGPVTALAFLSTIDDPRRFKHARDVGPYLGLTPTRCQCGETNRQGRISKCGNAFTRTCLYEAANVLLSAYSDDVARAFRNDVAQHSDFVSPVFRCDVARS